LHCCRSRSIGGYGDLLAWKKDVTSRCDAGLAAPSSLRRPPPPVRETRRGCSDSRSTLRIGPRSANGRWVAYATFEHGYRGEAQCQRCAVKLTLNRRRHTAADAAQQSSPVPPQQSGLLKMDGAGLIYAFVVTRLPKSSANESSCTTFHACTRRRHALEALFSLAVVVRLFSEPTQVDRMNIGCQRRTRSVIAGSDDRAGASATLT
jgi:hypothetical protein